MTENDCFRSMWEGLRNYWQKKVLPRWPRYRLLVLALGFGLVVYVLLSVVPSIWAGGDAQLEAEERGNFIAVLAGVFVVFGLLLTRQRNELSRDENRTNRYSEAVRLLGSKSLTERLGGIYALQRLSSESSHDAPAIAQLLAAFVRDASRVIVKKHSELEGRADPELTQLDRAPEDIIAAARTLGHRHLQRNIMGSHLAGTGGLEGAVLVGANLSNLHFSGVDLRGAYLDGVSFNCSFLVGTQLGHSRARNVDFQGAELEDAVLSDSDLRCAKFLNATVTRMHVEGSSLDEATVDTSFCDSVQGEWTGSPCVFQVNWLNDQ